MICDIHDKICEVSEMADHIDKTQMTMEKVLSIICFVAGALFLVAALCGMWRHFFTMGLCIAIGIMIAEDDDRKQKEKRHED